MINVLAIGNSFSQDATHYLHQIAKADQIEMKVVNLYIGGCNLERHWNNIKNETKEYLLEINGTSTQEYVSIQDALAMEEWDYIVTQQASHDSGLIETYEPFLKNLCDYLRSKKPNAKLMMQETWAYETDSMHPGFAHYHQSQQEMYEKLSYNYKLEAKNNDMELIPCGDVIQNLRKVDPLLYGHGGMSICRDGFHMNVIYGRYLLGLAWYASITKREIIDNTYIPNTSLAPNAICDDRILKVIRKVVHESL